jgi:hypothetical protein
VTQQSTMIYISWCKKSYGFGQQRPNCCRQKRPQFPCQDGVPRTYLLLIEMLEIQQGHKTKTPLVKCKTNTYSN